MKNLNRYNFAKSTSPLQRLAGGLTLILLFLKGAEGHATSFQKVETSRLMELQNVVQARINLITFLTTINGGTSPVENLPHEDFESILAQHLLFQNHILPLTNLSPQCRSFFEIDKRVFNEILRILMDYNLSTHPSTRLILRARLLLLSGFLGFFKATVDDAHEGGEGLLTGGEACSLKLERSEWVASFKKRNENFFEMLKKTVGVIGIKNAHELSTELAQLAQSKAQSKLVWGVPQFIALICGTAIAWELTASALGTFATFGIGSATGSLMGIQLATSLSEKKHPPLRSERDETLQSILSFLSQDPMNPNLYYETVVEYEAQILSQNRNIKSQLAAQEAWIFSKWDSLDQAYTFNRTLQQKLNDEISKR